MIDPDDLLQVARTLGKKRKAGAPKRVELRRAVSTAYYALFHFLCKAAADTMVGSTKAGTPVYRIVYRAFEHRRMYVACKEASKPHLEPRLISALGVKQFGTPLRAAASAFVELQDRRHRADYDPDYRITTSEACNAIDLADNAISSLETANRDELRLLLTFLLFQARS